MTEKAESSVVDFQEFKKAHKKISGKPNGEKMRELLGLPSTATQKEVDEKIFELGPDFSGPQEKK